MVVTIVPRYLGTTFNHQEIRRFHYTSQYGLGYALMENFSEDMVKEGSSPALPKKRREMYPLAGSTVEEVWTSPEWKTALMLTGIGAIV